MILFIIDRGRGDLRILRSEVLYKNFYSKLFLTHTDPNYIILLSRVYLTDDGLIYLEGQNFKSKSILNRLDEQKELLQKSYDHWKLPIENYVGNPQRALEFFRDKLDFLDKLTEEFKID